MGGARKDIFQPTAPEVRPQPAHGVSRGTAFFRFLKPRRGDRKHRGQDVESTAPPGLVRRPTNPRLTPWATCYRCFAAKATALMKRGQE